MPINTHLIFPLKAKCPKSILEWLNHKASLTDKLRAVTGETQLALITQQWMPLDLWSQILLDINDALIFQREIFMKSHGIAYWYARSIIPKTCYELNPSFFDRLQKESIRNLIFNDERVRRINGAQYPVDHHCVEFYWVKKHIPEAKGVFWVRLAEFSFQQTESFYLIEIMLPTLGTIKS